MYNISVLKSMLGKKVRASQFDKVYDIHIIITDAVNTPDGDTEGTLSFVGTEVSDEAAKLFKPGARICPIWNEKAYLDGDVMYDE